MDIFHVGTKIVLEEKFMVHTDGSATAVSVAEVEDKNLNGNMICHDLAILMGISITCQTPSNKKKVSKE